uniref:Uncharacterized protein n=1 Tax=Anopheles atroparvus TaxID=41427 RepID=A0A182JHH5_ANOAO
MKLRQAPIFSLVMGDMAILTLCQPDRAPGRSCSEGSIVDVRNSHGMAFVTRCSESVLDLRAKSSEPNSCSVQVSILRCSSFGSISQSLRSKMGSTVDSSATSGCSVVVVVEVVVVVLVVVETVGIVLVVCGVAAWLLLLRSVVLRWCAYVVDAGDNAGLVVRPVDSGTRRSLPNSLGPFGMILVVRSSCEMVVRDF